MKKTQLSQEGIEREEKELKEFWKVNYNEWLSLLPGDDWGDSFKNAIPIRWNKEKMYWEDWNSEKKEWENGKE